MCKKKKTNQWLQMRNTSTPTETPSPGKPGLIALHLDIETSVIVAMTTYTTNSEARFNNRQLYRNQNVISHP